MRKAGERKRDPKEHQNQTDSSSRLSRLYELHHGVAIAAYIHFLIRRAIVKAHFSCNTQTHTQQSLFIQHSKFQYERKG